MKYPIQLIEVDCSPLVIDNGFQIVKQEELAKWVAQLLLGNSMHIARVIEGLDSKAVSLRNKAVDSIINKLKSTKKYKRDGWLFQMISWIALKIDLHQQYGSGNVFMSATHSAPAQHGIDGFALVTDDKKMMRYIVLCEDKCSEDARRIIVNQVFGEFIKFENGEYDSRVLTEVSSVIQGEGGDIILNNIQEDISNNKYWKYRIGITRQDEFDDENGRKELYRNYDDVIKGEISRRSASSVNIKDMRNWMDTFCGLVINELEANKTKDVQ